MIAEFTGVSSCYEAPLNPVLILNTGQKCVEDCVIRLFRLLRGQPQADSCGAGHST
ncbi:MAG: hypothetical protein HHJ12_05650 [Glaciimonas sp.]|nr:hypothetical protein [Glaciimonas sp.]